MPAKKKDKHPIFDRNWSSLSQLNSYLKTTREKPKYFDGICIITAKGKYGLSPEGLSYTEGKFDPPSSDHLKENRVSNKIVVIQPKAKIVAKTGATKKTVKKPATRRTRVKKK